MRLREMSGRVPDHRFGWRAGVTLAGPLAVVIVAAVAPMMTGCAGRSPAEAENREIRLTQDGVVKYSPRFSPDGAWIAYAAVTSEGSGALAVYVIPKQGGEPRKISPDTVSAYPLSWSGDGSGVYCRSLEGRTVYQIGIDGTTHVIDPGDPFARTAAISPDGQTKLLLKFNQDNRDLGIVEPGAAFKFVAVTPVWEEEAILGPGAGEITVVSTPSYQAQASTISIWSPKTRSFSALPLPEGQKYQPAWSADGRLLAYCYRREGQADVWLFDAKNGRSAPLTDDPEDSGSPSWEPGGEWLTFCRSTKISHIYVGNPKKEGRRQITEGPDYDFAPSVSPDGRWVAFMRKFAGGDERGKTVLCIVPISGGPVRQLDLKGLSLPGKAMGVTWSPDAREFAFQASEGTARMDIYRIGRDGEGLARVTVDPGDEIEPRWSPDGNFISYTRVGGGQTRVVIVPAKGGLPRVMSPEGVLSEGGTVSPRSDRMVFSTFRTDGTSELWMAPLDAPDKATLLVKSKVTVWPECWSRDGKEVLQMRGQGTSWQVVAHSVDGGTETTVGRSVMLPSGKDMFAELSPEGAKFESLVYPGGIVVADGQDRSDLFLIRARMPDKPTALYLREDRFLCSGFVGLAGCF
jgi:Tol biopolymer transport system component